MDFYLKKLCKPLRIILQQSTYNDCQRQNQEKCG